MAQDHQEDAAPEIGSSPEPDSPAPNDKAQETPRETSERPAGGFTGVLAMLLALTAIGIASWPAYELYLERTAQPEPAQTESPESRMADISGLSADIASISRSVSGLKNELASVKAATAESRAESAAEETRLRDYVDAALLDLRARMGTSAQDWIYAEVEYLVRMANQRILMEQDAASALQLLESADQIIEGAEGLTAHRLRAALAVDIAALRAVDRTDVEGTYLALSALIGQVSSLKRTLPTYTPPVIAPPAEEPSGRMQQFYALVSHAGQRLASLVDFRRGVAEVQPLLPPEEEYFLRQNLVLKLQIAQLALLEGNEQVFRVSLKEAGQWITGGFDIDDPATRAMLASLTALGDKQIAREMPDISGSLIAVREHMARFHEARGNQLEDEPR